MRSRPVVVLALSVLTVACDHTQTATPPSPPAPTPAVLVDAQPTTISSPDASAQGALAAGSNTFGIDLYRALRKARGNIALSPFSVSMGFTMAWAVERRVWR